MKKILYSILVVFLLINISGCTGYKPIFGSSNLNFKIEDYTISGNKKLGNQIYLKLNNLSKASTNSSEIKNIYIFINVKKNKNATSKNSAGKILGYKINLLTKITIKDITNGKEILDQNFDLSSSYKVQDLYSETLKIENKSIEDLIEKTYQNLIIKLSENIL